MKNSLDLKRFLIRSVLSASLKMKHQHIFFMGALKLICSGILVLFFLCVNLKKKKNRFFFLKIRKNAYKVNLLVFCKTLGIQKI